MKNRNRLVVRASLWIGCGLAVTILKSTGFITLFRGGAGTGKSFVLRAAEQAVDGSNRSSIVLAPQRQQVIDLASAGLTQTQTVRECLHRRDLAERAVVIVDEAGQIDGRQLLDLNQQTADFLHEMVSAKRRRDSLLKSLQPLESLPGYIGRHDLNSRLIPTPRRRDASSNTERYRRSCSVCRLVRDLP
jgi:AAA domain